MLVGVCVGEGQRECVSVFVCVCVCVCVCVGVCVCVCVCDQPCTHTGLENYQPLQYKTYFKFLSLILHILSSLGVLL